MSRFNSPMLQAEAKRLNPNATAEVHIVPASNVFELSVSLNDNRASKVISTKDAQSSLEDFSRDHLVPLLEAVSNA